MSIEESNTATLSVISLGIYQQNKLMYTRNIEPVVFALIKLM